MYFSDLHVSGMEQEIIQARLFKQVRDEKPDVVLNAGDFSNVFNPDFILGMESIRNIAPYVKVMGNHDFYQNWISRPSDWGVSETLIQDKFLVVSASLWTNYFDESPKEMGEYKFLNDQNYIKDWNAHKALAVFKEQFAEIKRIVSQNWDKKIILLTHHGVSKKSISPRFANGPLNGSFVNDLDDWILQNQQIVLCVHGHVHQSFDYKIGETRIVCHPRGYPREDNYSGYYARFVEL